MRLAGQRVGGFFPAPPEAIQVALEHLDPPKGNWSMFDPCAGEGLAALQISKALNCKPENCHIIELDSLRAAKCRENLPNSKVLGPASFFGCGASAGSFSFAYVNPPFDTTSDGGRMESQFLRVASGWLMPGGVIVLICPEDVAKEYGDVETHFRQYFDNVLKIPFPADVRRFNEVMVFGVKRKKPFEGYVGYRQDWKARDTDFVYQIPAGDGPRYFRKTDPTEDELREALKTSPLRARLKEPPVQPVPSPPLAIGMGHVALLLASGHLDGVVSPKGQPPHVVRGTARKKEVVKSVETTSNKDDGSETTKTVITEEIDLVVRAVDGSGNISTFLNVDDETPQPEEAVA